MPNSWWINVVIYGRGNTTAPSTRHDQDIKSVAAEICIFFQRETFFCLFACLLEIAPAFGRNGNMKPRKPTHYPVDFVVIAGKSKILRFSARSYSSKAGSLTCALRAYARWIAAELCPKAA